MKNVLIFSGTTEGRRLAETLVKNGIFCHVCVATEYGLQVMESSELMQVHMGRLDVDAMKELYADIRPDVVIDATHPFAKIVSENIRESLQNRGIPYVRLERRLDAEEDFGKEEVFADSQAVCQALLARQGNILLTTGSKELHIFCRDERLRKRLIVRVLPGMESLSLCYENGLEGNQIIAMQGPFSEEINTAIYRQYDIQHMVTKESGSIGGMAEKLSAARKMGIRSYVIARPKTDTGNWQIYDEKEILVALEDLLGCRLQADDGLTEENEAEVLSEADKAYGQMHVALVGIGMGAEDYLTCRGKGAILNADYIFGASRIIEPFSAGVEKYPYYLAADIVPKIKELLAEKKRGNIAILFSGDTGFYSGCKKLYEALQNIEGLSVEIIPGISSLVYLASKIPTSWEDAKIISTHGVAEDKWISRLLWSGLHEKKVFFLTSGLEDVRKIGSLFMRYAPQLKIYLGYQLSYAEEDVLCLTPRECLLLEKEGLYVGMLYNDMPQTIYSGAGLSDEWMLRTKVPMTKEEIRHLSVAKLRLTPEAVCYDIGCGSGSISVEMAMLSPGIRVYAIDSVEEAVALTRKNADRFGLKNVQVVQGMAPEGMEDFPEPTHAFIGGSRGNMAAILKNLYAKNPSMRVVINAISLETLSEIMGCLKTWKVTDLDITQVQISKAKTLGDYHMMMGQNPITIVSFQFTSN